MPAGSTESTSKSLAPPKFSRRWHWGSQQSISFLMQQGVENPQCISLAAGLVDQSTLPVELTKKIVTELLEDDQQAREVLQYGTTAGAESLREELAEHLATLEGIPVNELGVNSDQVILTTGSQQLLSLVGEVLLDPDDICIVAAPTYFVFLGTLNGLGANIVAVPADENGIDPAALEQTFQKLEAENQLHRVKMVYLVDYYENPSGISLSAERRPQVLELVQRFSTQQRIYILEDAAYRELRYDGPEYPSIWSFDSENQTVILAQTFSKSFSPGLRVGFGVVPQELVGPICDRKGNEDFGSANFNQHLLAAVLKSGQYAKHVESVCASYKQKRDAMLDAADQYFADISGVSWVHPHGGLYVWMTLPEGIDTGFDSPLFERASQVDQVMYVPGDLCYIEENSTKPRNHMRLSFGVQTPEMIHEGMKRLATAVKSVG